MAELKWKLIKGAGKKVGAEGAGMWKVLLRGSSDTCWLKYGAEIVTLCDSRDAAKQLAQAIENLLDPPECPTQHRDADGNRWDGQTMWGKPFAHCPDCGALLGGSQ